MRRMERRDRRAEDSLQSFEDVQDLAILFRREKGVLGVCEKSFAEVRVSLLEKAATSIPRL